MIGRREVGKSQVIKYTSIDVTRIFNRTVFDFQVCNAEEGRVNEARQRNEDGRLAKNRKKTAEKAD